jgi:hypothetical protein
MPDARTIDTIMADLDDAGFRRDIVHITDRGYASVKNIEKYIAEGRAAIMGVRTGWGPVLDRIRAFGRFGARPDGMALDTGSQKYCAQYDLPYTVIGHGGKEVKADRLRINLYFDPVKRGQDQMRIDTEVAYQQQALETLMAEGGEVDPMTLKEQYRYFAVTLCEDGRHVQKFEPDTKRYNDDLLQSGFFANLTLKLDTSAQQSLELYKWRDEQEKYFMTMKSTMCADRQRNWSEEGKTGRLFILFVSLIIGSYLKNALKSDPVLCKKFPASTDLLDEMRPIRYIEHEGHQARITPFVGNQLLIAERLGFAIPKGCETGCKSKQPPKRRGRPRKNAIK